MHISAKVDYALRALVELAGSTGEVMQTERLAAAQGLPHRFSERILADLKRAGIVISQRGAGGGYLLARPATEITAADVFRAVDGPLAEVRGLRPDNSRYDGPPALQEVWIAVRASLRGVLEAVTVDQIARGELPANVQTLTAARDAWVPH